MARSYNLLTKSNILLSIQGFLARENTRWKSASSSSSEPIDPEEEKKLLDYIVERDWLEPVKPLWDPKTSKKSCAFVVAARTGKSMILKR